METREEYRKRISGEIRSEQYLRSQEKRAVAASRRRATMEAKVEAGAAAFLERYQRSLEERRAARS